MGELFVGEIIGPDILIILAIVMVLFGSAKIPKLARSLGQASHEFRKGLGEGVTDHLLSPPPAAAPTDTAAPAPAEASTTVPAEPAEPAKVPEAAAAPEILPPAHPGPAGNGN
ncbi:MAG: twin-arginine translocase TatA/TatE family subunit [Actinobacteria bacterium]|nr:twin-arginine translocase TatA/TatE family subunit [Actinomycetota bacterium]